MTAISATSAGVKDLADGSLRITLEFSPMDAPAAFELFGARGTALAVARLTPEAAKADLQNTAISTTTESNIDNKKGGQLSILAGKWCKQESFFNFIRPIYDRLLGGDGKGTGDMCIGPDGDLIDNDEFCKHAILVLCELKESRAELDHNPQAAEKFHQLIRFPYAEYLKTH